MGLVLFSLGFVTFPNVVFCLLFHIFGLFVFSLVVIGFAVDAIEAEEVEEAAVTIGWLCQLGLGLGAERGDVEQVVRVFQLVFTPALLGVPANHLHPFFPDKKQSPEMAFPCLSK